MNQAHHPVKDSIKSIIFLYLISTAFSFALPAQGQITPDNSLGGEASQLNQKGALGDEIDGGATRGSNLFHSFREFNIKEGQRVYFTNPIGVENILTRVTGGNASNIFGTLGVTGPANLFLINPAGILFGQNAQLDVQGSFVVTTANGVQFENQELFSATNPQTPSLLTVGVPVGLQYGSNPGAIQLQGASLKVPNGQTLTLAGGAVNIDGAGIARDRRALLAPGGRVELGGVSAAGTLGLNGDSSLSFPDSVERSDVTLSNGAKVRVTTADDGGSIAVHARNLNMTDNGTYLMAGIDEKKGSDNSQAGNIEVNATGAINLNNASLIVNQVLREAKGQAGNVNINAKTLRLQDGGRVVARTYGKGNGGNLNVNAQDIQLIGRKFSGKVVYISGLFVAAQPGSSGNPGNLSINTRTLQVQDGALVATGIEEQGKVGNLTVDAQDIRLIGTSAYGKPSGLFTTAQKLTSNANTGNLSINTRTLQVQNGAEVSASTVGNGNVGNLTINAQDIQLIGTSAYGKPSRLSAAAQPGSNGNSGNLRINTHTLQVQNGAEVSASTFGKGNGGNLTIDAHLLLLRRGSKISTDAGAGDGGKISINSKFIVAVPNENSDISAKALTGNGGGIQINSQGVFGIEYRPKSDENEKSNDITARSESGISGVINLNTPDNSSIQNSFTQLSPNVIDTNALIANSCIARGTKRQENSFTITGSGALRNSPGDVLISAYTTGDVRAVEPTSRPWKKGDPIIEAQGLYRLADGQLILSRDCS